MKKLLVLFTIALAATDVVRAAEEATPEAIAKRQLDAFRELDWNLAAFYTHPKALAQLKSLFLPVALAGATAKDNPNAAEMMRVVFAGKSADELASTEPSDFFKLVLGGITGATPDFKRAMSGMEIEVLGHVNEGEFTAHVVYRLSRPIQTGTTSKIAVTTVEKDNGTWKALLNADFENVVRAITARLQKP
jgi:hypothetical protein